MKKIVKLPIYRVLVPVSSVEEEFSKYREIGKRLKFESEIGVSELEIWDREFSRDLLSSRSQAFASIMIQACTGAKNMKTRIAQAAAPVRYSAAVEQVYNTKITCCEEVLPPCVVYLETSNCSLQPCAITKTYRSLSSSCVVAILLAVVGKKKINASSVENPPKKKQFFLLPLFSVPSTRETKENRFNISRPEE